MTARLLPLLLPLVGAALLISAGGAGAQDLARAASAATGSPAPGGADTSGELFEQLARMDSVLFDAAYVRCDMRRIEALFTGNAEFYHDLGGFQPHARMLEAFRGLTESCPSRRGVTRVLVPGSLRVYPIKDYGAVQIGAHRFVEAGAATGTVAQFVTLWKREGGEWRVSRALSFDHRSTP